MSGNQQVKETLQSVMLAHDIIGQFHENMVSLFRLIVHQLEDSDPSYTPMLEECDLWTSSVHPFMRKSSSWQLKHFAFPLKPIEGDGPIILLDLSLDTSFNEQPELWLGMFSDLKSFDGEDYPYDEAVEYIFQDYFGPEDDWNDVKKWYQEKLEDDQVSVTMSFCRVPLGDLVDADAVKKEICDRLIKRLTALESSDDELEEDDSSEEDS